jgi:transcriptional regulator with XRE-family HTH domain
MSSSKIYLVFKGGSSMPSEIGLALRLARVAVGKTQWQVAAKIGVHPSLLNLIESGRRIPESKFVRAMLDELSANPPDSPLVTLVLKEARRIAEEAGQ